MTIANVKDYGAKGDGHTDDRAACLRALEACRRIFLPPGRYDLRDRDEHGWRDEPEGSP